MIFNLLQVKLEIHFKIWEAPNAPNPEYLNFTFVYTFFSSEDTEKGLVEPEIKFSCFLAPKTWKSINKQQRYQQKRPILR